MDGAIWVLAAAVSFVGTHFAMSHPLRRPLVARLGEGGFVGLYSVVSFITLGMTIWAYVAAPATEPAWPVGDILWGIATVLMLVASILLMGSLIRNPAVPGAATPAATAQARGVYSITRHPMLWSFAIWAAATFSFCQSPRTSSCAERSSFSRWSERFSRTGRRLSSIRRAGQPGKAAPATCPSPPSRRVARASVPSGSTRSSAVSLSGWRRRGRTYRWQDGRRASGAG